MKNNIKKKCPLCGSIEIYVTGKINVNTGESLDFLDGNDYKCMSCHNTFDTPETLDLKDFEIIDSNTFIDKAKVMANVYLLVNKLISSKYEYDKDELEELFLEEIIREESLKNQKSFYKIYKRDIIDKDKINVFYVRYYIHKLYPTYKLTITKETLTDI